jgi:hypothetical protein
VESSNESSIDVIVPVAARDVERLSRLMVPSVLSWFEPLGTLWIGTRDDDYKAVRNRFSGIRQIEVVPETAVVPEFRLFEGPVGFVAGQATSRLTSALQELRLASRAYRLNLVRSGWFRQQLVKLAFAEWVETPFYLALDADILCVRPTKFSDLVENGRAVVQSGESSRFSSWPVWATRVLEVSPPKPRHVFTPAILAADAVRRMTEMIASKPFGWRRCIASPLNAIGPRLKSPKNWRSRLLFDLPWTEYALYFTYLDALGLFDRYHYEPKERRLFGSTLLASDDWSAWDPGIAFAPGQPFHFTVVQSNQHIPPDEVYERIGPYVPW